MVVGAAVKFGSGTQATIATLSGEAEHNASVKAAAEGVGLQAVALELGSALKLKVWVGSSAAVAVASRSGFRSNPPPRGEVFVAAGDPWRIQRASSRRRRA